MLFTGRHLLELGGNNAIIGREYFVLYLAAIHFGEIKVNDHL